MPEYEEPPPAWFGPYESWIAVRRIHPEKRLVEFFGFALGTRHGRDVPAPAGTLRTLMSRKRSRTPSTASSAAGESIPLLRGE